MGKKKNTFLSSLSVGNEGEKRVIRLFEECGISCVKVDKGIAYDLLLMDSIKLEVKYDIMSSKTGNIAIEFWNSKKNSKSGITATEADYWVHIYYDADGTCKMVHADVKELLKFIEDNKPLRTIIGGGDDNADLYLYKISDIMDIKASPFKPLATILVGKLP